MKRDDSEADSMSLKWCWREEWKESQSERVHCKECTEVENIYSTSQQSVTNAEKHTFYIQNHVVSWSSKRRSVNKRTTTQRQRVIITQETQDSYQDNRKKRCERDTKEVYWTDFSENYKHVNNTKRSDCVTSQASQRWCYTSCNELEDTSNSEKISVVSKRNCRLDASNV
jgi:hypothetical protein